MLNSPSIIRHPGGLLASTFAVAMLTSQVAEAGRCAREDYMGHSSLIVNAGEISAGDVQDRSSGAWSKIAEAAQNAYGGNVNVGMVSMTVMVEVQPLGFGPSITTTVPMSVVIDYSGQHSIGQAIRDFAGIESGARDPFPCEPEKNACCDECGAAFGWSNPSEFFKSGFFTHEQLVAARLPHGSRKVVVKKFISTREVKPV
jgi:hypothetical protein